MTKFEQLQAAILALSRARHWEAAKGEWSLLAIWHTGEGHSCLCTHYPIKELCELIHEATQQRVIVGNCRVKKFMGLPSEKIVDALKQVEKDAQHALNEEAIAHFMRVGVSEWEGAFYRDTWRKTKLSDKQRVHRQRMTQKSLRPANESTKLTLPFTGYRARREKSPYVHAAT